MISFPIICVFIASCTLTVQARAALIDIEKPVPQGSAISQRKITQHDRTFYKFVTRPDIDAPVFHVSVYDEKFVAPGYWFVATYGQLGPKRRGQQWVGPHIYDGMGELVWSGAPKFGYWNVFDFESRIVDGERMLTLLIDHEKYGFVLDSSYEIYKKVPLLYKQETKPNVHEFNVVDNGKRALLLTHGDAHATHDASQAVGFNGFCDAKYQGFREVSLDTPDAPEVIFEWDASGHIGLDETTYKKYDGSIQQQCIRGWDILHLNSIMKFPDGDYLLSARHTDALYKTSHADGSIVWRLGGVKSDFRQDGWQFSRQHHARVLEQNSTHTILTLFDNGIGSDPFEHATSDRARGLILRLDTTAMRADIIGAYKQPKGERTNARGSFQTLPKGNKFICRAYNSYMTEHTPDGTLVMEARVPIKLRSYRAFKHPWVGSPKSRPDIHAEILSVEKDTITVIHVSWNGDTRTVTWEFNEVDEEGQVQPFGSARRQGFETRFEYLRFAGKVFTEAFDADGVSLGKSEVAIKHRLSPLNEGGSSAGSVPEAEKEHEPVLQDVQAHHEANPTSPSGVSSDIFVVGLACGVAIAALTFFCKQLYKKHRGDIWREKQDTKYLPLQQDVE